MSRTSALVDLSWSVADATRVELAYAVVYVVTDAIGVSVFRTVTSTLSKSVSAGCRYSRNRQQGCPHIHIARLSWSVADATRVDLAHAVVDVVTDAIGVSVFRTVTTTLSKSV